MSALELKPCPFCGDEMDYRDGILRHREEGDCILVYKVWNEIKIDDWNERANLERNSTPVASQTSPDMGDNAAEGLVTVSWQPDPKELGDYRPLVTRENAVRVMMAAGTVDYAVWRKMSDGLQAKLAAANAKISAFEAALTPSAGTKAEYIGEFSFHIPLMDDEDNEVYHKVTVPWEITKDIMKAIHATAMMIHERGETQDYGR